MKKNKLKWLGLIPLVLVGIFSSSCNEDENIIDLEDIALSVTDLGTVYLDTAEIQNITVTADPVDASEQLIWTSSDIEKVNIQASTNGRVAVIQGADAPGLATITAATTDGSVTQTFEVEVLYKVHGVSLNEVPILFSEAQTSYEVVFTPAAPTNQQIVWTSSDESIATVDQSGTITAVSAGADGAPVPVTITAHTTPVGTILLDDLANQTADFVSASIELTVSGDPAVIGLLYCSVEGAGSYNPDMVTTTGADSDINHNDNVQPSGNYGLYEDEVLVVQPGGSFNVSVTQSNNWSRTLVWIDWNGDKDFEDDGEVVATFGLSDQLNDGPFNTSITVPEDAMVGEVRMRVLTGDAWTNPDGTIPCTSIANGTIKDFPVEIGGIAYCATSGAGAYHADAITSTGANTNMDYSGSQPAGNFEFLADHSISVASDGAFDLAVTNSNGWSRTIVWVDWNADGDFGDAGEQLDPWSAEAFYSGDDPISYSKTVTVPTGANTGKLRMRVLTGDAWTYDDASIPSAPCGDLAAVSIKDISLVIF